MNEKKIKYENKLNTKIKQNGIKYKLIQSRFLLLQIKELKKNLSGQSKTIQQFETEKIYWEQERSQLKKQKQQLLAELELLKNPPQQANKENIQVQTELKLELQAQVKELEKILPPEKIRTINSILIEQKNHFNQQLKQKDIKQLNSERERERERFSGSLITLLLMVIIATMGYLIIKYPKKLKRIKK